jgi:hypothetical protein
MAKIHVLIFEKMMAGMVLTFVNVLGFSLFQISHKVTMHDKRGHDLPPNRTGEDKVAPP